MTEQCGICGETVPFSAAVHLLVNVQGEDGAFDRYVCRSCYESELESLLA